MLFLTVKQHNSAKNFSCFVCVCVCVCVCMCVHKPVFMENIPLTKRAWLFILFF